MTLIFLKNKDTGGGVVRGFTVVEVLVVVFLSSVVMAALLMVLSSGHTSWYRADTQVALQQELRKALRSITEDLMQAGSSRVSVPANGSNYSNISFKVAEGLLTYGTINWSSDNITYSLSGDQIIRQYGSADTRVIANNITNMTFRRLATSDHIVRLNLTAQKATPFGQTYNVTIDTAVRLRND